MAWRTVPIFASGVEHSPVAFTPGRTVLGVDVAPAVVVAPPATTAPLHCVRSGCSDDRAGSHTLFCPAHHEVFLDWAGERTSDIGRGERP